jgi:hypothetical protein
MMFSGAKFHLQGTVLNREAVFERLGDIVYEEVAGIALRHHQMDG